MRLLLQCERCMRLSGPCRPDWQCYGWDEVPDGWEPEASVSINGREHYMTLCPDCLPTMEPYVPQQRPRR